MWLYCLQFFIKTFHSTFSSRELQRTVEWRSRRLWLECCRPGGSRWAPSDQDDFHEPPDRMSPPMHQPRPTV